MAMFAVVILVPSLLGFVAKFIEFANTFRGEADGAFAITPMVNYLLASLGFRMSIWATYNGMFHDMEQPKYTMLERERQLDEPQEATWQFPQRETMPPRR